MNSIKIGRSALIAMAVLLLLGSNAALADSKGTGNSQPLSFAVGTHSAPTGSLLDFGGQKYAASGGTVVLPLTAIEGQPLTAATLHFSLSAEVKGLKANGHVRFELDGMAGGQPITVRGDYGINNTETSTPANAFVVSPSGGACTGKAAKACSELPLSFIGDAHVKVTVGNGRPQAMKETMLIENPYLNPFGNPIVIASLDSTIVIVATYTSGTITWTDSRVTGTIDSGTLGGGSSSSPVTGTLSLNETEEENLLTGTATDRGAVALTGMTPSSLNAAGKFTGNSVIPTAGELDCSTLFGFPPFPPGQGVCTQTGFNSAGQYTMTGSSCDNKGNNNGDNNNGDNQGNNKCDKAGDGAVTIRGQYATTWTIPALSFSTTSTGTVTTAS
jgi:hypothetical protein